MNGVTAVHML